MTKLYSKHCDEYYKVYPKIYSFFTSDKKRLSALVIFKKLSTAVMYSAYVLLIVILAAKKSEKLIRAVLVPAAVFLIVTVIRNRINAPRPYEKYPLSAVIPKSTRGRSCPSRHSACAMIISLACLYVNIPSGAALILLSILIAVSRPLMGVHFPLDAAYGLLAAAALGIIGFFVI